VKKDSAEDGSFDPQRHFASVPQQQGDVQQDSDWNSGQPSNTGTRGGGHRMARPPAGGRRSWLRTSWRWLAGLAVGILLLGLVGLAIVSRLREGASRGRQPVAFLVRPSNGMLVPLHSTLPAVGEGLSQAGVTGLELWVNGQLWGTAVFDPAGPRARHIWRWTPSGEGEHLLFVRAIDTAGAQFDSPVVRVLASAQADVRFPAVHRVAEGETIANLAEAYGAEPAAILDANPGLEPGGALTPGLEITLPIPVPNAPPEAPEGDAAPAPPFSPLIGDAALPANFPASAEEAPITPGLEIVGGRLVPGIPMDSLYLYWSVGGGAWQRLPESPQTFLEPVAGAFDLNPYLDEIVQSGGPLAVRYHVWGWSGGMLTFLDEGLWTLESVPDGQLRSLLPTQLSIVGQVRDSVEYVSEWTIPVPVAGYFQGFTQDFRWRTSLEDAETMFWQVSTQPFPDEPGMFPPGTLGLAPADNPLEDLFSGFELPEMSGPFGGSIGGSSGTPSPYTTFSIDFGNYVDTAGWAGEAEQAGGGSFISEAAEAISSSVEEAFGFAQALEATRPRRLNSASLPRTFYVRLLPVLEDDSLGQPSNTVVVRYGPPPAPEVTGDIEGAYEAQVLSFTHYRAADPDYAACMRSTYELRRCINVVGFDDGLVYSSQAEGTIFESLYEQQCTIVIPRGSPSCGCPGVSCSSGGSSCSWSPSDWGSCVQEGAEWAFEAVKDFSNWASESWEWLKEQAVYVMLEFTPIGWGCQWAEDQDESGTVPDDFCHDAMRVALETGMAALGIPPSLPNFKELVENGKEYAFQMALQEMRSAGLECDSVCEEALRAGYNYAADQIGSGGGGGGGAGVPTMLYEPHPLAVEQPFTLLVRVERRVESAGIPDEDLELCGLSILSHAARTVNGKPVEGAPYEGVGLELPLLAPGDAITIPVVLERAPWPLPPGVSLGDLGAELGVIFAGAIDPATGQALGPGPLGMWSSLYPGSTLQIRLAGPYFGTVSSGGDFIGLPCVAPEVDTIYIPD